MKKISCIIFLFGVIGLASAISHNHAYSQLQHAGIVLDSSKKCTDKSNNKCISLEGMRQNTVSGLIALKRKSGCLITVMAGTEAGHSCGKKMRPFCHAFGYRVDLRLHYCVSAYITKHFQKSGRRKNGVPLFKDPSGNIYAREKDHWDVLYY